MLKGQLSDTSSTGKESYPSSSFKTKILTLLFPPTKIILNFRKAVGDHVRPNSKSVQKIVENINLHLRQLDENYRQTFSTACSLLGPTPTAFAREYIMLCDKLPFIQESLLPGKIDLECLFPMISPSRILSYSMFIEPIVKCRHYMKTDQLLLTTHCVFIIL